MINSNRSWLSVTLALGCSLAAAQCLADANPQPYIVEAHTSTQAADAVRDAGGAVDNELPIIDGVSAMLTPTQVARLGHVAGVKVIADRPLATQGSAVVPDLYQRNMLGVNQLAAQGINGQGVTVAVLDSGMQQWDQGLLLDLQGNSRMVAQYDAIANVLVDAQHPCPQKPCVTDTYGHGTHIGNLIASSAMGDPLQNGQPEGIAPMVHLINVKAFDGNGNGTYTNVLKGLNWILANQKTYGAIRVVNLSFGATPQSFYWNDPIDQAVMKLWQAGIVVVASAGNFGPSAQTIAVPGNTPYVITVGAMTDNFTPNNPSDDGVASFSSAGPTFEGFVKPDVVAPGGHLAAFMAAGQGPTLPAQLLAATYPQFNSEDENLFIMSGTSQAAAVTTGVVALMLQANPSLTPDQVKCRLLITADTAVSSSGYSAYSIYQQGAGRINAYAAVYSQATNCANQGLNVAADIAGTAHYWGPAALNTITGKYYVVNSQGVPLNNDGYLWNESYAKSKAYQWQNGYMWVNNGYVWNTGFVWNQNYASTNPTLKAEGYLWNAGFLWNEGYLWNEGFLWNENTLAPASTTTAMESWNEQE